MNELKNFIVENWRLLVDIVIFITSFIFLLSKKKPVKVVDSLEEAINKVLPGLINLAEIQEGLNGKGKKALVLKECESILLELGFLPEMVSNKLPYISSQVEILLSTPQKKIGGK